MSAKMPPLLAKNRIVVGSYPPCLSDLAPCNFCLFSGMNQDFKGRWLLTLQRFNENRWQPLIAFPLKILDNISSHGSSIEITALSHRGSAL